MTLVPEACSPKLEAAVSAYLEHLRRERQVSVHTLQ